MGPKVCTSYNFKKNSCFHRILNNSPYVVLFGTEPKLDLSLASLNPSISNDIITEEELTNELGILTNDASDVNSSTSDNEEDELNIHGLKIDELNVNDELNGNSQLNITEQNENNNELLTNRVKKANDIRETARQADGFLKNTAKRHKLADLKIGDNVVINIYLNTIQ